MLTWFTIPGTVHHRGEGKAGANWSHHSHRPEQKEMNAPMLPACSQLAFSCPVWFRKPCPGKGTACRGLGLPATSSNEDSPPQACSQDTLRRTISSYASLDCVKLSDKASCYKSTWQYNSQIKTRRDTQTEVQTAPWEHKKHEQTRHMTPPGDPNPSGMG